MKLGKTSDAELTKISALLIGPSGIGKTTSLGTLPEVGTVIASSERGTLPLRSKNYDVLKIESWTDIRGTIMAFGNPQIVKDDAIRKVIESAKFLAIDSLSKCAELCMRHIIQEERPKLVTERSKGTRDTPPNVYDELMTQEDWGLFGSRMLNLMAAIGDLPLNTVTTCLEGWQNGKNDSVAKRTVNWSGKTWQKATACFDLVVHMETMAASDGSSTRAWRTVTDGEIEAKNGTGIALDEFEPTDWTALFQKILKGGK